MNYLPPSPYLYPSQSPLDSVRAMPPVYTILILGMVLFLAANAMPGVLPDPSKIGTVASFVLHRGFLLVLFALLTQMTGLLPGVPTLHITYVHLAIAFILFFIMWNQIVSDLPADKPSSSSSSSSRKEEKKEERKESAPKEPAEPTPWDDERAHPSAFLTTRLNRLLPWPFPMGRAGAGTGNELWWESGTPSHVGHYNRPDPDAGKPNEEAEKKKRDERKAKEAKEKEMEKAKEKEKAKAEAEKAAAEKKKKAEDDIRTAKEAEVMKAKAVEAAKKKAVDDRQKQRLWRTKYLAMIIGISLLNKTLGFLLLLLFSIQLVSQELNPPPDPVLATQPLASSSSAIPKPSASSSSSSSSSRPSSDPDARKLAEMQAKEKERDQAKIEAERSGKLSSPSSSRSGEQPSSSSSSGAREASSSSSRPSSSSGSSKDKDAPITSAAVKEASGSKTVPPSSGADSSKGVPYDLGFGMHYIHTLDSLGKVAQVPPSIIPSQGMAHPLMSSTYKGYAN